MPLKTMDPRLLNFYNQELQHLREMGAEFAQQFPKIASRLSMDGLEVSDPYVERLLEGFAFLTARIQLKLDAEFPRFTRRLIEIVHPQFMAPVPAIVIAQLQPQVGDASLADGHIVRRGSMLRSNAARGSATECRFRTAHDVSLSPLEIVSAEYFSHASNLPLASMPEWRKFGGGVRLKLRTTGGVDFSKIRLDDLRLHVSGLDDVAYRLHELICGQTIGLFVLAGRAGNVIHEAMMAEAVQPIGFDDEHALLPVTHRGFEGYRLMQEYFAFPQRFLFFDLINVGAALRRLGGQEIEIVLLFARGDSTLQQSVDADSFALHCVPAINLFEQRCDRVHIGPQASDFHVVVDRARPMDFEIYDVLDVMGYGEGLDSERRFLPLYAAFQPDGQRHPAYFSLQREPRLMSQVQQRDGPRTSYIGSEVFISIVDPDDAPYRADIKQLGIRALVSNRDLPLLIPNAASNNFSLELDAPVSGVRIVRGPSRPLGVQLGANLTWRFINQLSMNHLSLIDTDEQHGAAALRELLRLYAHEGDAAMQRQVDGLRSVRTLPVVRRLPMPGPIAFGRGVRIELEVDELGFQGASAFLLGSVLEHYFGRHVSMNGFTEVSVKSQTRGEILSGKPRCGSRPVL
jgi:type VI secretion system protein ImpG